MFVVLKSSISASASVSVSLCLSVLSMSLSRSVSLCLPLCLSVCLYPSVYLSVCLFVCLSLSLCLSVCLCVSLCLSVCLSLNSQKRRRKQLALFFFCQCLFGCMDPARRHCIVGWSGPVTHRLSFCSLLGRINCRFFRIKPRLEFAFLHKHLMCVVHFKSAQRRCRGMDWR